jgi:hydrogenase/urease accessory protein HupE
MSKKIVTILLLLLSPTLTAHELGIAKVTVEWLPDQVLKLQATLPDQNRLPAPVAPSVCAPTDHGTISRPNTNLQQYWQWKCIPTGETDLIITFEWPLDGILINTKNSGQFYDSHEGIIEVPVLSKNVQNSSLLDLAHRFFNLGVKHILMGWDHLAFVLALCLLAYGYRLIKLITAFTIGHSLTLVLATTELITIAVPPVEACIALSIAWVARECLLQDHSKTNHGFVIVLIFGLLHGLGFASALNEAGLDYDNLLPALLFFNLGVEAGQLIFVAFLFALTLVVSREIIMEKCRSVASYGLGFLGMFWTIERVLGFY